MNDIISQVEISGFRSIDSAQIICTPVNVFCGLNDVGKSNILRALNLFFHDTTDYEVGFDFNSDYSKLSLAKAQRSSKKKQQVKIKVYFRTPASYKSLEGESLWVERVYDRSGKRSSEKTSLDQSPKKASLTRLVNSIKYFYIPALKGTSVLEYILGEIGDRNLMKSEDIVSLNYKVNKNISDLATILKGSSIDIKTSFELPVLVKDFWQRLNINTEFDEFSLLDETTSTSKSNLTPLKSEQYQISLLSRGDGVKSKYIPPLLKWIQEHDSKKFFVWGIDEPENSLEFKKAQESADLYFGSYAKNTQIFLTSHSLAFIFPNNEDDCVTVFRCSKTDRGDMKVMPLDDLLKEISKLDLADELGALEIQKDVIKQWRVQEQEMEQYRSRMLALTRPVVYTEGLLDKCYLLRTLELFKELSNYPLDIECIGVDDGNGGERDMGKNGLDKLWSLRHTVKNKTVVLLYDVDCNKSFRQDGRVVVYGVKRIDNNSRVYSTGIEYLLNFPDGYNRDEFLETHKKGDNLTQKPNKAKIKDYILSLDPDEQKKCLSHIKDLLLDIKEKSGL